ncbi:MAG: GlsB/YeaQ/YmgE family stress response membrane protein [Pseudanabaena frigida]|uniref:GlsB/YeaQ/YmgE family stress response membrane protein n=1 Tax=Pseudanabaena frigida TaxID=945775 RepID=A0A2W4VXX8_9CYAN|nr:MAG: GlsB/YeaQ/YmgE family stress response membrane protein [Pseudanabaena frigida]
MNFIWFILIGLAAGWLAGQLVRGGGFGLGGDIIVGVIGALLGGFLFTTFGVSTGGGLLGSLIVATIGAVVLLVGLRLIKSA